ncbi:hypothetical protein GCM10027040_07720 [Halomonas shantousis]
MQQQSTDSAKQSKAEQQQFGGRKANHASMGKVPEGAGKTLAEPHGDGRSLLAGLE